jgi:hypothetical protein
MWTFDSQWRVASASQPGTIHVVRRQEEGLDRWTCDCKGYRYGSRKHANYACRHIRQVWRDLLKSFEKEMKGF